MGDVKVKVIRRPNLLPPDPSSQLNMDTAFETQPSIYIKTLRGALRKGQGHGWLLATGQPKSTYDEKNSKQNKETCIKNFDMTDGCYISKPGL